MQEVGGSKPLGVTKKHPEIFPDAFSIESGIQIYRSDERVAEHAVYVVYNDEGILVVLFDQPFKSDQLGFVDDNVEDILLRPCIETFAVKHCHTPADFTVDQCTECFGVFRNNRNSFLRIHTFYDEIHHFYRNIHCSDSEKYFFNCKDRQTEKDDDEVCHQNGSCYFYIQEFMGNTADYCRTGRRRADTDDKPIAEPNEQAAEY